MGATHQIRPRWENANSRDRDRGNTANITNTYFSLLSDSDIRGLYQIYKDDFLMFGYSFTIRTLKFNVESHTNL